MTGALYDSAPLSLSQLLVRSTVRIRSPYAEVGTGFFVAPGWILTCAHVVADKQGDTGEIAVFPIHDNAAQSLKSTYWKDPSNNPANQDYLTATIIQVQQDF